MAFFPCIYFCENNQLYFTGKHHNLNNSSLKEKADIILKRANDREYFYGLALKMFTICEQMKLRLVVENPYATQHYLVGNFPYKAKVIDHDRTLRGDYFNKPTQYWFVNCEPTHGRTIQNNKKTIRVRDARSSKKAGICSEERSLISPDYARNFICDFIIGKTQVHSQLTLFN